VKSTSLCRASAGLQPRPEHVVALSVVAGKRGAENCPRRKDWWVSILN
jgi:hypothetical protein